MKKFSRAGKRDLAEMFRTEIVFPRNKISFCVVAKELCFHNHSSACFPSQPRKTFGNQKASQDFNFPARQGQATLQNPESCKLRLGFSGKAFSSGLTLKLIFCDGKIKTSFRSRSGRRGRRRNKSSELFFFSLFCSENLFFQFSVSQDRNFQFLTEQLSETERDSFPSQTEANKELF